MRKTLNLELIVSITMVVVCCGLSAFAEEAGDVEPEGAQPEAPAPEWGEGEDVSTADDHIQNLRSLDVRTRIEAARALRELRDPRALSALTQTVRTDPSPEVRGWALRALWRTDPDASRDIIIGVARTDADRRIRDLAIQLVPEAAPAPAAPTQIASPTDQLYLAEQWMQLRRQQREENRRSGRPLRSAGWLTFGLTYGMFLCIIGPVNFALAEEEYGWPLFIPVIGPVIAASFAFGSGWEEDIMFGAMMIIAAVVQSAGLAMAILGHVRGRRYRNERQRSVAIAPTGPGLSLVARF